MIRAPTSFCNCPETAILVLHVDIGGITRMAGKLGSLPQRRFAAHALTVGALQQLCSSSEQQPRQPKAAHGTADGIAIRMRSMPWRLPARGIVHGGSLKGHC